MLPPRSADLDWQTSRSCSQGACVQVAAVGDGTIAVRDSKDPAGPILRYSATEWREFLTGAKDGDFDNVK
ncbi:hypothetical protein Ari01nite_55580 [Paractinoplanes rishiriensis]|uniref:DUF397 domain-containing protein n=1 Tax=Paractinoplanes rishiriensis TaxID=1050105 RepID=A0A919MWQ9_9ACTN|nr:hypothetical protein Ari01nite_55580 [Actinoplanes rishiriensis]